MTLKNITITFLFHIVVLSGVVYALEQNISFDQTIDLVGYDVAISGDWIVIGSPGKYIGIDTGNEPFPLKEKGSILLYKFNGKKWELKQEIHSPKYEDSDNDSLTSFGANVDIVENQVVVGDEVNNKVYIYSLKNEQWEMLQTIEPPETHCYDFGLSVKVSSHHILISTRISSGEKNAGICVFDKNFNHIETILPENRSPYSFGYYVDIKSNNLVVIEELRSMEMILIHFYRFEQKWIKINTIEIKDIDAVISASISDNYAAIGSIPHKVFIYKLENNFWTEKQILTVDLSIQKQFGTDVSIKNNFLIVGASYANPYGSYHNGCAYIYRLNNDSWQQYSMLSYDREKSLYGHAVDLDDNFAVIGGPSNHLGIGQRSGAVYISDDFPPLPSSDADSSDGNNTGCFISSLWGNK